MPILITKEIIKDIVRKVEGRFTFSDIVNMVKEGKENNYINRRYLANILYLLQKEGLVKKVGWIKNKGVPVKYVYETIKIKVEK